MNRRSFLKALGLGSGATALSACGLDDNRYYTPVEQVLPYVTHPEQTTPGTPSFFATAVGTGPRAWPVTAVHREGRIVNVGANGRAWENAQIPRAVPATHLFDLQRHYSPDRVTGPQKGGAPVEWAAALTDLTGAARAARAAGKKVAWLGPYTSGTLPGLLQQVTGGNAVFYEPLGLEAEALASKALFGADALPSYDLSGAHYILSFGAPFLGDAWGSPAVRTGFATARDANAGGHVARFAAVTPVKDQTAANADDWYACAPGSEAQVALALAKMVAREKSYQGPGQEIVAKGDPAAAAAASGLTEDQLRDIAKAFAAGGAVALPGGLAGASAAATELAAATYLLNIVAGSRDHFRPGGYPGPIHAYADVEKLVADMNAGSVGLLLLGDLDAVHVLPGGDQLAAAMAKVDMTVALTSHSNETTKTVKMVLPTHSVFEDWGDEEPWSGFRIVRQPAMPALNDTRSLGDLLLEIWRAMDAEGAPKLTWREALMARWATEVYQPTVLGSAEETKPAGDAPPVYQTLGFQRWWEGVLGDGFHAVRPELAPLRPMGAMNLGGAGAPTGTGDMSLVILPHGFLLDGRYANEPWAQETPDPMTGHVWDTWALLHPATARKLGVTDNDLVTITTAAGSIDIGVEVTPCVREDVVAVPLGGGHTEATGRYAAGVGQNIVKVLAATKDASGALAWQQAKCSVKSAGKEGELHSTFGVYPRAYAPGSYDTDESDSDRRFVAVVHADEWDGDKETDHPGELTGIHHLPMDQRLQDAGIEGFYGLPDHPTYRFGLTVDTNSCNGCGACVVACYAENNLPVVGKVKVKQGREISWIRINRYYGKHTGDDSPSVHFVPMMCQQCGHAPCESVCPVLATYHTIDGLNAMIYNRCVGTRYCSNACPYSARKFNYHSYVWPEPFNLQLNPAVATRTMGVMEKCTFCIQRIRATKSAYRDMGFKKTVPSQALEQLTACAEACPSQALTFGNINDPESLPNKSRKTGRNYIPIAEINTYPAVNYLARASFHAHDDHHGGGEHAAGQENHPTENAAPHGADGH